MKVLFPWLFLLFGCIILFFIVGLIPTVWVALLIVLCLSILPWIIGVIIDRNRAGYNHLFSVEFIGFLEIGNYVLALLLCIPLFIFFKWIPTIAYVILGYLFVSIHSMVWTSKPSPEMIAKDRRKKMKWIKMADWWEK